jgi:hypothetical protein
MESTIVKTIRGNWLICACLAVTAVLMTLVLVELLSSWAESSQRRLGLAGAFNQNAKDPNDSKVSIDAAKNAANALKKKNLFAKEPPKEHPIKQVDGILGSEALIQNKWYKAGDKVGDAKILSISATGLEAEWEGKKTTFSPIASASSEPRGPSKPPGPAQAKAADPNKPAKKADANEVKAAATPQSEDPFAFMGVNISPKLRAMLLEKWNSMSDADKEKAKEEWNKMPEEQKQQAMKALESMESLPSM